MKIFHIVEKKLIYVENKNDLFRDKIPCRSRVYNESKFIDIKYFEHHL